MPPKWRDIKRGDATKAKQSVPAFCITSLPNRFKAFITDSFMVLMPLMYISVYFVMGSLDEFAKDRTLGWGVILVPHFLVIVGLFYKNAQTMGMKAYDMVLVDYATKAKPSLLQIVARYFLVVVSIFSLFLLFVPFFNKDRRSFHDILTHTLVIDKA